MRTMTNLTALIGTYDCSTVHGFFLATGGLHTNRERDGRITARTAAWTDPATYEVGMRAALALDAEGPFLAHTSSVANARARVGVLGR